MPFASKVIVVPLLASNNLLRTDSSVLDQPHCHPALLPASRTGVLVKNELRSRSMCCCCYAVVEGWLDIAKLVASEGSKSKGPYEDLAFKIGGWTLAE